jgi:hypothetical protein
VTNSTAPEPTSKWHYIDADLALDGRLFLVPCCSSPGRLGDLEAETAYCGDEAECAFYEKMKPGA